MGSEAQNRTLASVVAMISCGTVPDTLREEGNTENSTVRLGLLLSVMKVDLTKASAL